jgi:hypothetical protein
MLAGKVHKYAGGVKGGVGPGGKLGGVVGRWGNKVRGQIQPHSREPVLWGGSGVRETCVVVGGGRRGA